MSLGNNNGKLRIDLWGGNDTAANDNGREHGTTRNGQWESRLLLNYRDVNATNRMNDVGRNETVNQFQFGSLPPPLLIPFLFRLLSPLLLPSL